MLNRFKFTPVYTGKWPIFELGEFILKKMLIRYGKWPSKVNKFSSYFNYFLYLKKIFIFQYLNSYLVKITLLYFLLVSLKFVKKIFYFRSTYCPSKLIKILSTQTSNNCQNRDQLSVNNVFLRLKSLICRKSQFVLLDLQLVENLLFFA